MDEPITDSQREIAVAVLLTLLFICMILPPIWWMREISDGEINFYIDGEAGSLRFRYSWPVIGGMLIAALYFVRNAAFWLKGVVWPAAFAGILIFPMAYVTVPLSYFMNFFGLYMVGFLQFVLPTGFAMLYCLILSRSALMPRLRGLPKLERFYLCTIFVTAEALHLFGYWVQSGWYYTSL